MKKSTKQSVSSCSYFSGVPIPLMRNGNGSSLTEAEQQEGISVDFAESSTSSTMMMKINDNTTTNTTEMKIDEEENFSSKLQSSSYLLDKKRDEALLLLDKSSSSYPKKLGIIPLDNLLLFIHDPGLNRSHPLFTYYQI